MFVEEEVTQLEGLDLDDEVKCQSLHRDLSNLVCSVEVTHILVRDCYEENVLICTNHARTMINFRLAERSCGRCKRLQKYCMRVVPI